MLEDKAVPVLVCLTYADKLYAEHMGEDGSHPDPRDVSQEITKETEVKGWGRGAHSLSTPYTMYPLILPFLSVDDK